MPIYEYYCDSCQHQFEALRPVSSRDEPAACSQCSSPAERKLSTFAFRDGRYGRVTGIGSSPEKPADKGKSPG